MHLHPDGPIRLCVLPHQSIFEYQLNGTPLSDNSQEKGILPLGCCRCLNALAFYSG